jgi:transposase
MKGGNKMNYIGLDIHKQFTFAVAKDEKGLLITKDKFENSKENFEEYLKNFPKEETKILMESTCVWEYIFEIIQSLGYDAKLSNPVKTKAIACARIKTDAVDASTLSDLLRANLVAESYIPPKEIRRLREIARERRAFVKGRTQIKNRIQAILIKRGMKLPYSTLCLKALKWILDNPEKDDILVHQINLLENFKQETNFLEEKIRSIASENKNAKLLMTIPGIGEIRAIELVAEIGEISRFQTADKLCSYAGLIPSIKQSGNTLRFGNLIKQSSRTLKFSLIEAAWVAVRTREDNSLKIFYKKLCVSKSKQKSICAVARKMCCIVHAMLRKQEEFRDFIIL